MLDNYDRDSSSTFLFDKVNVETNETSHRVKSVDVFIHGGRNGCELLPNFCMKDSVFCPSVDQVLELKTAISKAFA